MIKQLLVTIVALLLSIFLIDLISMYSDSHRAESRIFCAYDRIFVEFEDGKNKWGTLMLDESGRPINCKTFKPTDEIKGYM